MPIIRSALLTLGNKVRVSGKAVEAFASGCIEISEVNKVSATVITLLSG